jgi:hypothetical protein
VRREVAGMINDGPITYHSWVMQGERGALSV